MAPLFIQLHKPDTLESSLSLSLIALVQSISKSCLLYLPHIFCTWPLLSTSMLPPCAHHHYLLSGLLQILSQVASFLSFPPFLPTVHYPTSDPLLSSCVSLSTPATLTLSLYNLRARPLHFVNVSWNDLTPRSSCGSLLCYQERGLPCNIPPLSFMVPFFSSS